MCGEGPPSIWNELLSKPSRIEAEPGEGKSDGGVRLVTSPQTSPQRLVVVSPDDIFPKGEARRAAPFPFELVVSRYILVSGIAVALLSLLIAVSLWLLHG